MLWLSGILSNVILASLLALAAWFVQRRLGRHGIARILWLAALVKLVTPPLISVPLVKLPGRMACALGACECAHAGTQTLARDTLPWILLAAWSAGASATAWTAWRRWTGFRRIIAKADRAPPDWQSLAARLSSELSLWRTPEILTAPSRLPPLVVPGWRRPCMLLPAELIGRLDASQRVALLTHELVHIRRGDHLVRLLELTVRVAFWWLPVVGSIGRQLRACEEACCDAEVVARLPQARRDYARLLLDVVDFSYPLPPRAAAQATALSAVDGLERRLRAILVGGQTPRRAWPIRALTAVLALAILPCGLHYDIAGRDPVARKPSSGSSYKLESSMSNTRQSGSAREAFEIAAFCCPS